MWHKAYVPTDDGFQEDLFASKPFLETLCSYSKYFMGISCSPEDIVGQELSLTFRELAMLCITVSPQACIP